MREIGAVDGEECESDPPIMTSPRVCRKCQAVISADAPEGLCTACLFERGADRFTDQSVAATDLSPNDCDNEQTLADAPAAAGRRPYQETMADDSVCGTCGTKMFAGSMLRFCPACLLLQHDESASTEDEPILTKLGDYELLDEIGRGGQ